MRIKNKLILSFFIGALPVIAAGAIVYYNLRLISRSFDVVTNDTTPAILFLSDIRTDFLDGANNALAYAISGDTRKKAGYENDMRAFQSQKKRLTDLVASGASVAPQKDLELLAGINSAHEEFTQAAQELFSLSHDERDGDAGAEMVNAFTEKIDDFMPNIDAFMDAERREINETQDEVAQAISQTLKITIFLTVFVLSLSLWANGWIFKSISRPLTVFKDKARAIANGFSEAKVDIRSQDEFGELAQVFNEMTDKEYKSRIALLENIRKNRTQCEKNEMSLEREVEDKTMKLEKLKASRSKREQLKDNRKEPIPEQ